MKKLFIIALAATLAIVSACKKDGNLVTVSSNVKAPELTSPAAATAITVTATDSTQRLRISWNKADYGVQAVVNYFVQIDSAGRNFSKKVNIAAGNDSLSLSYGGVNNILLTTLKMPANSTSSIEIRTGSAIYGKDSVFSKPVKLMVTTYKELAPSKLYVAGAYQGWNPGAAPNLYPVTTFAFEGYVYIGSASEFKFTTAPDFSHINYGDGGAGKLGFSEPGPSLYVANGGYYKINADVKNLTYGVLLINSFSIIGSSTEHGWDSSTAMTFNSATGKWTVTANLVPGALKFRANDAWDINYGPADSNALTGTLKFNDTGAITINDAGNYTITLDMSQTGGAKYAYIIKKN